MVSTCKKVSLEISPILLGWALPLLLTPFGAKVWAQAGPPFQTGRRNLSVAQLDLVGLRSHEYRDSQEAETDPTIAHLFILSGSPSGQLAILPTRLRSIATSSSAFQIRKLGFLRPHCTYGTTN